MLACCSGESMAICSSDNCKTCIISCAFSLSVASFGMPVGTFGIRFDADDDDDDDDVGVGCCGGG